MARKKKDEYGIQFFEDLYQAMVSPKVWNNYITEDFFDYPDYGGLPAKIYNKLSGDVVDFLQDLQGQVQRELANKKKRINVKKRFYNSLKAFCFPLVDV